MLQRDGRLITKVLDVANGLTLAPVIRENIEEGSTIMTDGFGGYAGLKSLYDHKIINHEKDEYVKGDIHTNTVEGFFSHLKRTIKGTHIKVSTKYLQRYANEAAFKYTNRHSGQKMFHSILKRTVS